MILNTGESDFHISREGVYPSWFGYAMWENAPFNEDINKWFEKAVNNNLEV